MNINICQGIILKVEILPVQTYSEKSWLCVCFKSFSIIDWNNPVIINKMYKVYLGDVPLKTKVCCNNHLYSNLTFFFFNIQKIILFYIFTRLAVWNRKWSMSQSAHESSWRSCHIFCGHAWLLSAFLLISRYTFCCGQNCIVSVFQMYITVILSLVKNIPMEVACFVWYSDCFSFSS